MSKTEQIEATDDTWEHVSEPARQVVQKAEPRQEVASYGAATPMTLLEKALDKGVSTETLEQMMALQERWEANQARKAFDSAMAAAKSELPIITRNREVDFTTSKGRTHYKYEDFGAVAKAVEPVLSKHGLSFRFRTQNDPNQPIMVTCVISHEMGHSETTSLSAGRDDTGNKNSIQALGSTVTYLQRYTLKAALGLAASYDDDNEDRKGVSEDLAEGPKTTTTSKQDPKSSASMKRGLDMIDNELVDCFYISEVDKLAQLWAKTFIRDEWPQDFIDIAIPKFNARRDEIRAGQVPEDELSDDGFPGDLPSTLQAGVSDDR